MKLKVETSTAGKRISWFNDIGVCIATVSADGCEVDQDVHPRIWDAAQAAHRGLTGSRICGITRARPCRRTRRDRPA